MQIDMIVTWEEDGYLEAQKDACFEAKGSRNTRGLQQEIRFCSISCKRFDIRPCKLVNSLFWVDRKMPIKLDDIRSRGVYHKVKGSVS